VVYELLAALLAGDGAGLLAAVARVAEQATDFAGVLEEMLVVLHRIAIAHAVPDGLDNSRGDRERILDLAAQLAAEDAQLFYQIALNGRRDLPLSVDPRSGLEMTLLRMLAFKPQGVPQPPRVALQGVVETEPASAKKPEAPRAAPLVEPASAPPARAAVDPSPMPPVPLPSTPAVVPVAAPRPPPAVVAPAAIERARAPVEPPLQLARAPAASLPPLQLSSFDNAVWTSRFAEFGIGGVIGTIAAHCCVVAPADSAGQSTDNRSLHFVLDRKHASFFDEAHTQRIVELLGRAFGEPVQAVIEVGEPAQETPAAYRERQRQLRLAAARQSLVDDPNIRLLQDTFGAVLEDSSIEPLDD
jgi:DNA polymerase-3 subunit gamma/tau